MNLHVGTSGYGYKEWRGIFYPENLGQKAMLGYYAERLNAVEINYTFYHMPTERVLSAWAELVGDDFAFAIKAPQIITHWKRLKDVDEECSYFFRTVTSLGPKLGAVLLQFPSNFHVDRLRLEGLLRLIPESSVRCAFEFRSPTWFEPEILELLSSAGCAICTADSDEAPSPGIIGTASWGYLRLRGTGYDEAALRGWLELIRKQKWDQAFAFFKHEDDAKGPGEALRILEMAGQGRLVKQ